ncbi:MAG: SDR family NAD(P)-dependent oxidoreductase [Myxococcales bacterium]|nr:SDR family NAD(P)-dependent oxidoreductase [Myxococcales bacterium]
MSLVGALRGKGPSGFGYDSTAEDVTEGLDLTGRTILVTGCNSGLGLETARVLALRGARVVGAARTEEKAREALAPFAGEHLPVACELSEPASVRAAVQVVAEKAGPLDAIIANAGIMALPERNVSHGLELQFLTNHVGHFLLVTGLLDRLAPTARVVMLSSTAHTNTYAEGIRLDDLDASRGYTPWGAYGQSKLANLLFAKHLATRLPAGQTANSLHPGVIWTNLGRHMNPVVGFAATLISPLFLKTIPAGASTQTYVATHPDVAATTGEYFADCNIAKPSAHGRDAALAEALWTKTEELVAAL